jgi:ABC-type lipoprotein export system ATPase subunit
MVTHENDMAAYAGRIISLKDGKIIDDSTNR